MGGLAVTLLIALIWLSILLPKRIKRWANGLGAALNLAFVARSPHRATDILCFVSLHLRVSGCMFW